MTSPHPPAADRPLVLVSNRGPIGWSLDGSGTPVPRRGAGGLVSGLAPLVEGTSTQWVAAALSDADRQAARAGLVDAEGFHARLLDLDPDLFRLSYDVVCNAALWFVHHGLFDVPHRPRYEATWAEAWAAYRSVNEAFADAVADDAPEGAAVLVQDYHLCLVAPRLREARPDLRLVHFSHTPFAGPDDLARLPTAAAVELLEGMAAHHACGFHTERWAARFRQSCDEVLGSGAAPPTYVSPLAPDPADLAASADRPATAEAAARLDGSLGDRQLVARVDRIELSKNVLRGLHAFDDLLTRYPRWRGRVCLGAFLYPSREGLPEYLAYRQEVETLLDRLRDRWGEGDGPTVLADLSDDYPTSVAALQRYDVLLVNPVRDGLNLVAKEGPLLNRRHGSLVLSREAGVWPELGDLALGVNPYDVAETADALHAALSRSPEERAAAAAALASRAAARTPSDWLAEQLAAAG